MKTHKLAAALRRLAMALEHGPDVPLEEFGSFLDQRQLPLSSAQLAVNLSTLVGLSRIDKQQWVAFINEHDFPIKVRPRDASRDILGKLLRHLEKDADARRRLRNRIQHSPGQTSPELMKALQSLLRD